MDRANAARCRREQIHDLVASKLVTRRRFSFNQRTSKRQNLVLTPRKMSAQGVQLLADCFCGDGHLISCDRTVKRSIRARLISNPIPGFSGAAIVPFELTVTAG